MNRLSAYFAALDRNRAGDPSRDGCHRPTQPGGSPPRCTCGGQMFRFYDPDSGLEWACMDCTGFTLGESNPEE